MTPPDKNFPGTSELSSEVFLFQVRTCRYCVATGLELGGPGAE